MSDSEFCIVLSTVNNDVVKRKVINGLLSERLSACIQVMPIESYYVWDDKVCQDDEQLLIIKTQSKLYKRIENTIKKLHNYDVPQIVQLPIESGLPDYLAWVKNNTVG
ncbi:divalent-cation tolerance protein CutA [Vibrio penaeicida]|uniref:divalent-cation tolerance protein CutA n=1 Tax=Vibrio penaeicida TaxID=104609 RepID=UPI0027328192|nr:divalent-cation tolerance protein CutA [Vibrio penaeicida]MDP2572400.1 divalent-cation tolerance protein CutA [Vibrio penaeicida]